jgi:hypothetical protein
MSDWVFNFPPLPETIVDPMNFVPDDNDLNYPYKLVLWEFLLGVSAKDWYINNAFTDAQQTLYSAIFNFYGKTLLDNEVRIFASLNHKGTDEYLKKVQDDYLVLQGDLQNLFKLNPQKLYYINAVERRRIFINVQCARTTLKLMDIDQYAIGPFTLFRPFPSLRMSTIAEAAYQEASSVFWRNITQLNAIDPYGSLYLTKSLDLGALRELLKKYPTYKNYFAELKEIKLIIGAIVDLYTGLNQNVEQLKALLLERDEHNNAMMLDFLEKQERVLSSRKPEGLFVQINTKIVKLNSIFLKFNASFILSDSRRHSIDLRKLTDNFFYSDYVLARESVEDGLRTKLGEILRILQ